MRHVLAEERIKAKNCLNRILCLLKGLYPVHSGGVTGEIISWKVLCQLCSKPEEDDWEGHTKTT
jgi:hypothetical protein